MDAPAAESDLTPAKTSWLERERLNGRLYRYAEAGAAIAFLVAAGASFLLLRQEPQSAALLSPPLVAMLLVANLIPAIALMVLFSRRIAMRRAERGGLGTGRLHTRLVALFSVIAAVPTVLVAIFASVLFQSGLDFWFSDRARGLLENTTEVAQSTYRFEFSRVGVEATTMAGDLATYVGEFPLDDPKFQEGVAYQTYRRSLNEAAVLTVGDDGNVRTLALVNAYEGMIVPDKIKVAALELNAGEVAGIEAPNRIALLTPIPVDESTYLYVARYIDPEIASQIARANRVLADYHALVKGSWLNQLRFNAALLFGSLIIVALAIFAALRLADRLVRPVGQLADAAGRIEEGDFSARVPITNTEDEIA
ncbi:MAG TPA: HAMP domain-containing protein, partial [Sphingomicrobium sp.]|nr:HAMP domain-containing protein [Sphingomicrobium sp.]